MSRPVYDILSGALDISWLMQKTGELLNEELGQCASGYKKSARYVENLLRECSFEEVRRIPFPADGRTVYQDKKMPLCWKASTGKLTVKQSPVKFDNPVVADLSRHPFHLIKGSVSTPPEGIITSLVTYEQMLGGEDVRGAMVIAPPDSRTIIWEMYRTLCDFGALGMVYDWLGSRYETPDALHWVNAWTEGPDWHTTGTDRPLIGFSVTPRTGDMLRNAARGGRVVVCVQSDGENYEGEIDVVTGIVPGRDSRELWLMAHLYEPMSSDNSSGVVSSIEIARKIKLLADSGRLAPPKFTMRVIFALERYGFAAYAASRGECLKDEVIGAINVDANAVKKDKPFELLLAPPPANSAGSYAAEEVADDCGSVLEQEININERGTYQDDCFLNDSTTGVPTVYRIHQKDKSRWHSSAQDMDVIDEDVFHKCASIAACWVYRMAAADFEGDFEKGFEKAAFKLQLESERIIKMFNSSGRGAETPLETADLWMELRFKREKGILEDMGRLSGHEPEAAKKAGELETVFRRILEKTRSELKSKCGPPGKGKVFARMAETIIPERLTAGTVHSLARVPEPERGRWMRRRLPENIVSNIDGKKTLAELIAESDWENSLVSVRKAGEKQISLPPVVMSREAEIKKHISSVEFLTRYGYLKTSFSASVSGGDTEAALKESGISSGDSVFLAGDISCIGHIDGGEDAVIDAFLEVIGDEGTLLVPAFTRSCIYFDGICVRGQKTVPFDINDFENIVTGEIARKLLQRKESLRSAHPTHSVAAVGAGAEAYLSGHAGNDPPFGKRSPVRKLADSGGKFVWFGADPAGAVLLHCVEDELNLPCLRGGVCLVKNPDGSVRTVLTPGSPAGHRDFYGFPGEETKIFRRLGERGFKLKKTALGFGEIKTADAGRMYREGLGIVKENPSILLCGRPDCFFCSGMARGKID